MKKLPGFSASISIYKSNNNYSNTLHSFTTVDKSVLASSSYCDFVCAAGHALFGISCGSAADSLPPPHRTIAKMGCALGVLGSLALCKLNCDDADPEKDPFEGKSHSTPDVPRSDPRLPKDPLNIFGAENEDFDNSGFFGSDDQWNGFVHMHRCRPGDIHCRFPKYLV